MKKILVITDNSTLLKGFKSIILKQKLKDLYSFDFRCSPGNAIFGHREIIPINVNTDTLFIIDNYDLVISLHCKQIFPPVLVNGIRCINVHPGYNPYNRGWFPQAFSIINGEKFGATIHIIDEYLDHGPILEQEEVRIESWDTSLTAYNKVLSAELILLEKFLVGVIEDLLISSAPISIGNLNLKSDYKNLCLIDMQHTGTFSEHIDKLRALSHGDYNNAYFIDSRGNKIFIKIELTKDKLDE